MTNEDSGFEFLIEYSPDLSQTEIDELVKALAAAPAPVTLQEFEGRMGLEVVVFDAILVVSTLAGKTLLDEAVKSTWAAVTKAVARFRQRPGAAPAVALPRPRHSPNVQSPQSIILQIDALEMREIKVTGLKVLVPLDRMDERLALALPEALDQALTTGAMKPTGTFHLDDLPPFVD